MAASDWTHWDDERGGYGWYDEYGHWHPVHSVSKEGDGHY